MTTTVTAVRPTYSDRRLRRVHGRSTAGTRSCSRRVWRSTDTECIRALDLRGDARGFYRDEGVQGIISIQTASSLHPFHPCWVPCDPAVIKWGKDPRNSRRNNGKNIDIRRWVRGGLGGETLARSVGAEDEIILSRGTPTLRFSRRSCVFSVILQWTKSFALRPKPSSAELDSCRATFARSTWRAARSR